MKTLFVVDVFTDWAAERNWHTKPADTWKVGPIEAGTPNQLIHGR